ncbi:1-acyl-sn-glycerol-3-phosphate acyltransferase [Oceanisphaera litoralis]|uniref:1-acyl-sn-glycerol-3-phosphate acyltransferase n=1 Tax=Oceanisphaera litoralis TaxID=225144 RepID=UPI00195ABF63|nr:1-acyl-sn-glycerol-3-phosphate acyltransferase [Oceanisphaera litoralis]MBM7455705.1 1-acyl-sn-glycerol-3-phosphate acyltransferase [Oceanisphaera litoralis]
MVSDTDLFKDIRPYRDDEVAGAIQRLIRDDEFIGAIAKYRFSTLSGIGGPFIKALIRLYLSWRWRKLDSIRQIQQEVAVYMEKMISSTTSGVSYSGLDQLDPDGSYLFISNHRDIALDPAFVNWGLHSNGLDTVRIAIGDNLLRKPCAAELMKLNKSFIVKRSAKGPREMMKAFSELSAYLRHSLDDGHSIWIAQKEGRAKDGNDKTDPAILKMFYMEGKRQKIPFGDYIKSLNLVPVSISYEYDPGDLAKARELYAKAAHGAYEKSEFEDVQSIVQGIVGQKGRVHVSFGEPVRGEFDNADQLAVAIDRQIHANYHLFPSNLLAAGQTAQVDPSAAEAFEQHMARIPAELRELVLSMYARPVLNKGQ